MDMAELGIKIDEEGIDSAAKAFDRLAASIKAAREELEKLEGKSHGGIMLQAVGEIVVCNVLPHDQFGEEFDEDMRRVRESIRAGARRSKHRFSL